MFNDRCCLYVEKVKSVMRSYYYYLRWDSGALLQMMNICNDEKMFFENKLYLVYERLDIIHSLEKRVQIYS